MLALCSSGRRQANQKNVNRDSHLTLQSLLSVPEFLQLCEVLVEDEDFGDAESGRTHVQLEPGPGSSNEDIRRNKNIRYDENSRRLLFGFFFINKNGFSANLVT